MMRKLSRQDLGSHFSEGARALWAALEKSKKSQKQFATDLGIPSGLLPRWLYGDRRPGLVWATKLQDALKIKADLWHRDPVKPFVPPAALAA